jgi:hypothetical protein
MKYETLVGAIDTVKMFVEAKDYEAAHGVEDQIMGQFITELAKWSYPKSAVKTYAGMIKDMLELDYPRW